MVGTTTSVGAITTPGAAPGNCYLSYCYPSYCRPCYDYCPQYCAPQPCQEYCPPSPPVCQEPCFPSCPEYCGGYCFPGCYDSYCYRPVVGQVRRSRQAPRRAERPPGLLEDIAQRSKRYEPYQRRFLGQAGQPYWRDVGRLAWLAAVDESRDHGEIRRSLNPLTLCNFNRPMSRGTWAGFVSCRFAGD